ncbi:unnamed protein product [Alternaria alternata]
MTFRNKHETALHRLTEDFEPSGASTDESDSSDSPWEVSSDSEVEKLPGKKLPRHSSDQKSGRPQSPAKPALLDAINFIVDCLWRLPIRRPAPADRMRDKTVADTTGYLPFDLMYVRDKFPGLNETVTARLAKMISRRRQLIRYRKDHTAALQEEEDVVVKIPEPEHDKPSSPLKDDVAPSSKAPSRQTLWPKTVSYSQSVSSTASEQAGKDVAIRIPNRPTGKDGKALEHFICPYCSTAQYIVGERQWKKHVLLDIQPHICTYPECQLNEYFFESVDDWFNHESRVHRVDWFCNTESHESFCEISDFLDHMHTNHSETVNETQLLSLHHGFQRPSRAVSGACTLCGKYANKLKSHLSQHLQQIALFAIPQTDYMAHWEEEDTSSNAARQSIPKSSSAHSTNDYSELYPEASTLDSVEANHSNEDEQSPQSGESYKDMVPDISGYREETIDTSWDQITPKFKEARIAMGGEEEEAQSSDADITSQRTQSFNHRYDFAESLTEALMKVDEPRNRETETRHNSPPSGHSKAVHYSEDLESVRHFLQTDRPITTDTYTSPIESPPIESPPIEIDSPPPYVPAFVESRDPLYFHPLAFDTSDDEISSDNEQ